MKYKIGLIWRIIIAIGLAVGLGLLLPQIHEGFAHGFTRVFATFNMLFGGFLNYIVPFIIIAFIAPGIAKLGTGSGKLLGMATGLAYASTLAAGILAYVVAMTLLPNFIGGIGSDSFGGGKSNAETLFQLDMIPIMDVMSALMFAFIIGIGMASIKSTTMLSFFDELHTIIEKVISFIIIPLLPFHIFGIFLNMSVFRGIIRITPILRKILAK